MKKTKTYREQNRFFFLKMMVGPLVIAALCAGLFWLQHHGR